MKTVVHERSVAAADPKRRPIWRCSGCGRVVDCDGYIEVDLDQAGRARRMQEQAAERLRSQRTNGGLVVLIGDDIFDLCEQLLERAEWKAWHRSCDPNPAADRVYWFDVARAATWPDVVDWWAHLDSKRWLPGTDWIDFVQRAARPTGGGG